jgi:hypothetical protein
MARYFFDFRSDGPLSADDEGLELLDADVAHQQAVGALVEGIRDIILEGAKDQRFAVEVRDDLGRVLQISGGPGVRIFRSSNLSDATYRNALHGIAARIGFSHLS